MAGSGEKHVASKKNQYQNNQRSWRDARSELSRDGGRET